MTDIEPSFDLGILGVGAIAEAIVTGLCEDRDVPPSILLSPRGRTRSAALASRTVAAHFAYLATVSRWLTARGIKEEEATRYVAATFAPLAGDLSSPPADLMTLAAEHATAGGLNEQFYGALRDAGVFETVERSLDQVVGRLRR